MEVLIAACLLAWAAGAQSEQAKLGISPAQRAVIREQVRHEKTLRRIAEKHDGAPPAAPAEAAPLTVPEAFRSGYRQRTVIQRAATPIGRRAGGWAAEGIAWAGGTGRGALREYRRRRQAGGRPDPAPVLVPAPPNYPPSAPTAAQPAVMPEPSREEQASPAVTEPVAAGSTLPPSAPPAPAIPIQPAPHIPGQGAPTGSEDILAATFQRGAGRMATDVTYESVRDESDELALMCDDDLAVYERIRERCEREIGRADTLIAELKSPGIKAWIARCAEQYRLILTQLAELRGNTLAQGEGVEKAKALLLAGQGVYADIAADMETVEEREFYISDAIDGEDANAEAETYETQGAHA